MTTAVTTVKGTDIGGHVLPCRAGEEQNVKGMPPRRLTGHRCLTSVPRTDEDVTYAASAP